MIRYKVAMVQDEAQIGDVYFVLHRSDAWPMEPFESNLYVRFTLYAISGGHGWVVETWKARAHYPEEIDEVRSLRIPTLPTQMIREVRIC